jgi:hypothetical protein
VTGRRRGALLALAGLTITAGAQASDVGDVLAEFAVRVALELAARAVTAAVESAIEQADRGKRGLPELEEWKDPKTGSTSRMASGCGVTIETLLTGDASENYLSAVIVNEGAGRVVVELDRGGGTMAVSPGERAEGWTIFSTKEALAEMSSFEVTFAIQTVKGKECVLPVRYTRAPSVVPSAQSRISYSSLEFWFGGGLRLAAGGSLDDFGRSGGLAFDFGMTKYVSPHHALSLDLVVDEPSPWSTSPRELRGTGYALGYALRGHVLPWLSITYGPAFGGIHYRLSGPDGSHESTEAFLFQQRVRLQARFSRRNQLYLGASLTHQVVSGGEIGGELLRGSTFAALLSCGYGL